MQINNKNSINVSSIVNKIFKRLGVLFIVTAFSFSLSACGGGGSSALPDAAPEDITGPVILTISPTANEIDVPAGTEQNAVTLITVTLDEVLNQASILPENVFIEEISSSGIVIPGTQVAVVNLSYTEEINKLVIVTNGFEINKEYQVKIQNFSDKLDNKMLEFNSNFSTTRLPSVETILPLNNSNPVSVAQKIIINFDEVMNEQSLKNGFTLTETLISSAASTYKFSDQILSLTLNHQIIDGKSIATYSLLNPETGEIRLFSKTANYSANLTAATDLKGNSLAPVSTAFITGVSNQTGNAPTPPGKLNIVTTNNAGTFNNSVTWPITANTAYNIYVSKDGASFVSIATTLIPSANELQQLSMTYIDSTVTVGVRYKYAVSAMNIIATNIYSAESLFSISGEVIPSAVAVPKNLIAIAGPNGTVIDGTVKLTWDAIANNKYNLYESSDGFITSVKLLTNTSLLTYSYIPTLGNDVLYQYGLTIENADGSESAMIKSETVVPFGALAKVTASGNDQRVTVKWPTWKNVPGVSYSVYVKVGTSAGATFSTTPIATDLTVGEFIHGAGAIGSNNPPLPNDISYTYGVVSISTVPTLRTAIQKNSNIAVTSPRLPPNVPINIIVRAGDAKVNLTWDIDNSVPGVVFDYRILQKAGNETTYTEVALLKSPLIGKAEITATNNIQHSYQIAAIDAGVEGAIATTTTVVPRYSGRQISAWNHTCVIKTGDLWCWGDNTFGQLGNPAKTVNFAEKQVKVAIPTTGRIGSRWIAVATGQKHTCAIRDSGDMYCWGEGAGGQLGGTATRPLELILSPQLVSTPAALAIDGVNGNAQVNWTQVVAGASYTCGIHRNTTELGQLFCWGNNSGSKLGILEQIPAIINIMLPEPVVFGIDPTNNWIEIQANLRHTCGIRQQTVGSTLWCWGESITGQIGDGIVGDLRTPVAPTQVVSTAGNVSPDTDWSSIALGREHTCAVRGLSNTLWCWGNNNIGQLSTQSNDLTQAFPDAKYAPVQESSGATDWVKVFANRYQTCGLKKSGAISCWGNNSSGESGDGSLYSRNREPRIFAGTSDWSQLALGTNHTCGIKNGNSITPSGVSCWGSAEQYGIGTFTSESAVPVQVGIDTNWQAVTASSAVSPFVVGLHDMKLNYTMFAWGSNEAGGLGNGDLSLIQSQSPVAEINGFSWKEISAGKNNVCAILNAVNTLYCWGQNRYIPLAPYDPEVSLNQGDTAVPTQIGNEEWLTVDHGSKHACGIKKLDSSLWCWGRGQNGRLGAGSTTTTVTNANNATVDTISPTLPDVTNSDLTLRYIIKVIDPVLGIKWTSVSAGGKYTCAIGVVNTNTSDLYCWGKNRFGQLGLGINSATNITTTTTKITTDSAGNRSTIESDEKHIPTLVAKPAGVTSWLKVSAGLETTCAITDGGVQNLYCWGSNTYGILTSADILIPVLSPELIFNTSDTAPWVDVSIVDNHACARRSDNINDLTSGSLWCWGLNDSGQTGVGNINFTDRVGQTNPQEVFIKSGVNFQTTYWKNFTTGNGSTCAIKDDNSLWCWGRNFNGQLGTNNAWKATATAVTFP